MKDFISALFDFSFSRFIATTMAKVLYIIAIIFAGLGALVFAFSGFANGFGSGLFTLILSPVLFFFWVIFARLGLEMMIAVIKIAENTGSLKTAE